MNLFEAHYAWRRKVEVRQNDNTTTSAQEPSTTLRQAPPSSTSIVVITDQPIPSTSVEPPSPTTATSPIVEISETSIPTLSRSLRPSLTSGSLSLPTLTTSGTTQPFPSNNTLVPTLTSGSTESSSASSTSTEGEDPSAFMANKPAVAATLVVIGLLVLAAAGFMLYWLKKKVAENRKGKDRWNELGSMREFGSYRSPVRSPEPPGRNSGIDFAAPATYAAVNRNTSGRSRGSKGSRSSRRPRDIGVDPIRDREAADAEVMDITYAHQQHHQPYYHPSPILEDPSSYHDEPFYIPPTAGPSSSGPSSAGTAGPSSRVLATTGTLYENDNASTRTGGSGAAAARRSRRGGMKKTEYSPGVGGYGISFGEATPNTSSAPGTASEGRRSNSIARPHAVYYPGGDDAASTSAVGGGGFTIHPFRDIE